jgi:DNA invertase Pin-like site-specific DNA recombinase
MIMDYYKAGWRDPTDRSRRYQNYAGDEEVLRLLAQGCSYMEIACQLNISPRTVKQHLRTLFLRAGITDGRKRVKLATDVCQEADSIMQPRDQLTTKEIQVATFIR